MKDCFQKNFRFERRRQGSRDRQGKRNQTELLAGSADLNEGNSQIIREEQRWMEADLDLRKMETIKKYEGSPLLLSSYLSRMFTS
jgi:hypothetical protein